MRDYAVNEKDGVRYHLNEEFALQLTLDSILCKKRDLREAVIETAVKEMRELVRDRRASFYEIYESELSRVWNELSQSPTHVSHQFVIAQASPNLTFVQFTVGDDGLVRVHWQPPKNRPLRPAWLWLNFRRFERSIGREFGILPAQMEALFHRLRETPEDVQSVELPLTMLKFPPMVDGWALTTSSDRKEVYLKVDPDRFLPDAVRLPIKSLLKDLCTEEANLYSKVRTKDWSAVLPSKKKHSSLAPPEPIIILVASLRSDLGRTFNLPFHRWLDRASPDEFDPVFASTAAHIRRLMQAAEKHLYSTPSEQRLFNNVCFTYNESAMRELAAYCKRNFSRIPSVSSQTARPYMLALQITPVFAKRFIRADAKLSPQGSTSFIKPILREAAAIGLLSSDFAAVARWFPARISADEVGSAVKELVDGRLLSFDPDRQIYHPNTQQVVTQDQVSGSAILNFYSASFQLTTLIAETLPSSDYFWNWHRISQDPAQLSALEGFMHHITKGFLQLENACTTRDCVLQATMQLFEISED